MEVQQKAETKKVATHEGILTIGETDFNVAVLKDEEGSRD